MSPQTFSGNLSLAVPPGWFVKESITVLADDGQANVITSSEPLDPSITTSVYANTQGELLRSEFPGFEELSFDETQLFGDRTGFLRRFTWLPPDGVQVLQIQTYYVEGGRGYTSTATLVASAVEHEATVVQVLVSVRLQP